MHLDSSSSREESEHLVTIDWLTASGQCIVDAAHILVNDEYVALAGRNGSVGRCRETVGADNLIRHFASLVALLCSIGCEHMVDVESAVGQRLVEIRDDAIAQARHRVHQRRLFKFNLAVARLAFEFLLGEGGVLGSHLFESLTYL